MQSVLYQLYHGEISPTETITPKLEAYRITLRENRKCFEDFRLKLEKINPNLSEQFMKILDMQWREVPLEAEQIFTDSFCLGARIMLEICQKIF